MKKSIHILIVFFSVVITGSLLGSMLFMLYGNLTSLVANQKDTLFSFELFVPGIMVSFPLVCILALLFVILLNIRHSDFSKTSLITYLVLGLLTWFVFIPFDLSRSVDYITQEHNRVNREILTDGIFRTTDEGIEYLSRVTPDGLADGIFIDTTGSYKNPGTVLEIKQKDVSSKATDVFADTLIRDGAELSQFVSVPLNIYAELMINGTNCYLKGVISWISFAFMGLALISCAGLSNVSSWKLLNIFFVVFMACITGLLNYEYYSGDFFNSFAVEWARFFHGWPVDNPFMVILNLVIAGVCTMTGVIRFPKKAKSDGEVLI